MWGTKGGGVSGPAKEKSHVRFGPEIFPKRGLEKRHEILFDT
jgi:hypothetical protein